MAKSTIVEDKEMNFIPVNWRPFDVRDAESASGKEMRNPKSIYRLDFSPFFFFFLPRQFIA